MTITYGPDILGFLIATLAVLALPSRGLVRVSVTP